MYKVSRKKIEEYLCYLGINKHFVPRAQKALNVIGKKFILMKLLFIKIKNFYSLKDSIKKRKEVTHEDKIVTICL